MIPRYRAWYDAEMYDEPVIHSGECYLDWRDFIDGNVYMDNVCVSDIIRK